MIPFPKLAAVLPGLHALVVLLALARDRLIFPRWALGAGAAALPASAERLALDPPSGEELVGVLRGGSASAEAALVWGSGATPGTPTRSPSTSVRSFRTGTS